MSRANSLSINARFHRSPEASAEKWMSINDVSIHSEISANRSAPHDIATNSKSLVNYAASRRAKKTNVN